MTGMLPLHLDATYDDHDVPLFDLDDEAADRRDEARQAHVDEELALDEDWRCIHCGHSVDDHSEDGCERGLCDCRRRP